MKPERWEIIDEVNEFVRYTSMLYDIDESDCQDIMRRYDMTLDELRQLRQRIKLYKTIQKASRE